MNGPSMARLNDRTARGSVAPRTRPGVTVRLVADEPDIDAMIALGRRLHAESHFHAQTYDEARLREFGRKGLSEGSHGMLVAERNGAIIGMAVVVAGGHVISAAKTATIQVIYVAPEHRGGTAAIKLLRAIHTWSVHAGADTIIIGVTSAIAPTRTDRLLRRIGFLRTGANYVLERSRCREGG